MIDRKQRFKTDEMNPVTPGSCGGSAGTPDWRDFPAWRWREKVTRSSTAPIRAHSSGRTDAALPIRAASTMAPQRR